MHLLPTNRAAAGELLNSPLWADLKRCLMDRRTASPEAKDEVHVAAAKGHARAGFEKCIEEMEKIPFEFQNEAKSPFERPAVAITQD